MKITIRNYNPNDLENVVALINATDSIERLEDGTSIEEMQMELTAPGLVPEQNVFVAENERGQLIAFGMLRLVNEPIETTYRTWFVVHPDYRGEDTETQMLARMYARAEERLSECTNASVRFHTIANALEHERIASIQKFGMREVRRFWQMMRPLDQPIPEPRFPEDMIVRAYRVGDDDARVNDAKNEAFRDHFGGHDQPLESWVHYIHGGIFRPDLTLIAQNSKSGEIAGFSINEINSRENERLRVARGWIAILGVRRAWRKHGLGTALLLQSMKDFREAGLAQAVLGCDSENPTGATRIYERVGFRVIKTRVAFGKAMRVERDASAGELGKENASIVH